MELTEQKGDCYEEKLADPICFRICFLFHYQHINYQLDPFGEGVWGFGADAMSEVLHDPDCTAYWVWAGPNDGADDTYLRLTIGQVTAVTPQSKLATTWGMLKSK